VAVDVVGVTKVRSCCTFLWLQDARSQSRVVFARPYHCAACVGEMVRSAKLQRITVAGSIPMDRVREALTGQRAELLDRWRRQLGAAADAGFALDPATAEVLPELLEAADRALERRFRPVPLGTPALEAAPRRAAMQSSLLGDFLFDSVLESCPELNVAAQRLLSDALAHAAVEVLVHGALLRDREKRRRELQKVAKLAHQLRNSVTAVQLSLDLLRRKRELPDTRAGRALQSSLSVLRDQIEDSLLDDLLHEGGLRFSRVRLGPLLSDAQSAASELGALDKVTVLLEKPARPLLVQADARLVRPAIDGLLRAALRLARPGSTIHFGAAESLKRARVAVSVGDPRKLPGNRLPDLPSLGFARRAARAHGGSLSTKVSSHDGWELRLDLPRLKRG
jgi:signal transduction histidine kinase